MCEKQTTKRMDNPEDTLLKRQIVYAGDILHQFHEFPGEYCGPLANEYPNPQGGIPRVDGAYVVKINETEYVMNIEDESIRVDENSLIKLDRYRRNLEYSQDLPVISVIRTPLSKDKCQKILKSSPTLCLCPWIISLKDCDGAKRLSNITTKIKNNVALEKVEAMNLVMIPRMFEKNQEEILEKVCILLHDLKIEDAYFKFELIMEMRCVIHKYAKTIDDIERLEGVIGLQQAKTAMDFQNQLLIEQGIEQGRFDMALEIKRAEGIEKAIAMSGFSREELENEKLNGR